MAGRTITTGATPAGAPTSALRIYELTAAFWQPIQLNALWLLACLPAVTAGAATVALTAVVAERAGGDHRPIGGRFWWHLRRELLPMSAATLVTGLTLAGVLLLLVGSDTFAGGRFAWPFTVIGVVTGAVVLFGWVNYLPLRALSPMTGRRLVLRQSVVAALAEPVTTWAKALLAVAATVAVVMYPPVALVAGWLVARLLVAMTARARRAPAGRVSGSPS